MSERLEEARKVLDPAQKSRLVRIYQALHGNIAFATLQNIYTVIAIVATYLGKDSIDNDEVFRNAYIIIAYMTTNSSIRFWGSHRKEAEQVVGEMRSISQVLEEWSTKAELDKLTKASNKAKLLADAYHLNACTIIVFYAINTSVTHTLSLSIPILPDTELVFWVLEVFEMIVLIVMLTANAAMLVYHLRVSICMAGLLENISEQFLSVKNVEHLNKLIEKHCHLCDTASRLRSLCSRWTVIQLSTLLLLLTGNTFNFIQGTKDFGSISAIPMALIFIYVFCVFGESIIVASGRIGECAYRCNWLDAGADFRRKVVLVILRSQTPLCLDAGLIGDLSLATFEKIVKTWYKFLQALFSLM